MQMNRVAIVGVGCSRFGSTSQDVSYREMIFEAAVKCYEEAGGVHPQDIDAFVASSEDFMEGVSIADEYVPDQLGAYLKPVQNITAESLQGFASAVMHVQIGMDLVVASVFSKASNVLHYENVVSYACDPATVRPLGENPYFIAGLEMQRFLHETGNTVDQCAQVVVDNKYNALKNPLAVYGARTTVEQVMASPQRFSPLKYQDIANHADGAIVILLASERKAREITDKPIWVKGIGWATDTPNLDSRGEGWGGAKYARLAAQKAYKMAGISAPRREICFAEIDDTFSYKQLQHLEALNLCSRGDAGKLLTQGVFSPKGDFPVNVSGGNLGVGYLHEGNGLHKLAEVVWQLRGEAGARQLDGVKTGLAFSWRGIPTATGVAVVLSNRE
jgi:acetyl-CoA C-acetyltransferase